MSPRGLACALGAAALSACGAAPERRGSPGGPGAGDSAATEVPSPDPAAPDTGAGDTAADTGEPAPEPPPAHNGCLFPGGARASGALDDPRRVDALPYTDAASTADAPGDAADTYDCAPSTRETGPERWYRFTLAEAREVRVEVADGDDVDVDVHLLSAPAIGADGAVTGCLARDDRRIVRTLGPGTYWVAVDTWASAAGVERPGDYTLAVEGWVDGAWAELALEPGLTWRHFSRSGDDPMRVNALLVDPALVELAPASHGGCATVPAQAARIGARAGINASFYASGCVPRTFLRVDGETLARPDLGSTQRVALWSAGATPVYRWLAAGADDTSAPHGIGGYPSLRTDGADAVEPLGDSDFFRGRHPRTAFGTLADGRVAFVVVDGRSSTARGITLPDFAALLGEMGLVDAINLDGGGSSTLSVRGCSVTDAVNFPSDGGGDTHGGARAVADGVYAWPAAGP